MAGTQDYSVVLDEIKKETAKELAGIMKVSPKQAIKDTVKKMLGRSVRTEDPMFWPAGMLMLGLAESGETNAIEAHIDLWQKNYGGKIDFIDDALAGYSLIKLYEKSGLEKYRKAIDEIRDHVMNARVDECGAIIYNPGRTSYNIFADGIGQTTMFLAAYSRMMIKGEARTYVKDTKVDVAYYSESIYLTAIAKVYTQLFNYHMLGRDSKSGLIYHGYTLESPKTMTSEKKGLLGWGRACGWLMMGLAEAACMENELKKLGRAVREWSTFDIIPWYKEQCRLMLEYQRPDGGYSWQVQAIDGHIDMSATGMIVYAFAKGVCEGVIDKEADSELYDKIHEALKLAKDCMLEHAEKGVVQDALSSCDDFGVHYQTYGAYPWGQGAVLAALSIIGE